MNSLRPLVTITILVVVGAFLYVKINQSPVRPVPRGTELWPSSSQEGVPPLGTFGGGAAADSGPAPPWPGADAPPSTPPVDAFAGAAESDAVPPASDVPGAVADNAAVATPAVPAIPGLLEMSPESPTDAAADMASPAEPPVNVPVASYPDEPSVEAPPTVADAAPAAPPLSAAPPAEEQPSPLANGENSLRPTGPAVDPTDRYATSIYTATPTEAPAATSPQSTPTFATSWPAIQQALDRGELAKAHELLSRWYGDASLTPTDAERVEMLLSQLAGTVVYSTEHHLEPPHVVKPGETLQTIAEEYKVPWQLLAKINGVSAADAVPPGQELKVVRGPFAAVVDLDRRELVLMLDGRYAGKFPVTVPAGQSVSGGEWLVDQKVAGSDGASVSHEQHFSGSRLIVLREAANPPGAGAGAAPTLVIAGLSATGAINSDATRSAAISVSPQDAEELTDILSLGSRVVIRR